MPVYYRRSVFMQGETHSKHSAYLGSREVDPVNEEVSSSRSDYTEEAVHNRRQVALDVVRADTPKSANIQDCNENKDLWGPNV